MFTYHLAFLSPWYLLLLPLIPVLWWYSFRKVAGLGAMRRIAVLILRSLVLLGLILAMAEIQVVKTSDRLTTIFLLDQSLSIPVQSREAMIKYVNAEIRKHRQDRDRAGAIVFGRDAAIEIPPFDDNVQMSSKVESIFDPEYTNLAAAMKLAQASFPEDAAKRIVIISDGNQNLGNAVEQAQALAAAGVGIDVLPVRYQTRAEIIVERVAIPADVRRGQPFDLRVVTTNTAVPRPGDSGEVRGRLQLSRSAGGRADVLSDEAVILPPGKKVFTIRQEIDQPNFYTYEARFVPDRHEDDAMPQNNRATAFTHVQGKGRVLLIEDADRPGEFAVLVERLRKQGLEVDVQPTSQLFTSLAELQPYDAVVLANVPRDQDCLQRRPDRHARAQHAADGGGPGHARRAEQLRRRRLDRHRTGKGHARRFPNQVGQGGAQRGAGHDHARQRNGRRATTGKRKSLARPSRPWARKTIAA